MKTNKTPPQASKRKTTPICEHCGLKIKGTIAYWYGRELCTNCWDRYKWGVFK